MARPERKPQSAKRAPDRSQRGSGRRGTGRERAASPRQGDRKEAPPRRKAWSPDGGQLPKWVSEELARVTPKAKVAAAAEHLLAAASHFAAGRYGKALGEAEKAKELSSRDATTREILGLASYRLGRWETGLRELRTFRRLTGDTSHMPVEMDLLRALNRSHDVTETWKLLKRLGGDRATRDEAKVVYASHLLDIGEARQAWQIADPGRITADPPESTLRVWYVASRAAHELGDDVTARRLFEAIERSDTAFPGLEELGRVLRND